jgi:hypothetical protein
MVPWQAKRVEVRWTGKREQDLPDCGWLFYLGEGGKRVALRRQHDHTYRINGDAVQLIFPKSCS